MAVTPPPTGSSPAAGVAAGSVLSNRYRLDGQLASGGMAQVWRGTDEVLRRSVAVKILHPHLAADDTFVARFRQEAIAVARLSHPAIVSVYDTCSDDGIEAIVMELVRGQTLRQRLDAGVLGPWVAANIAAQVAGALDVAHVAGLVHRDIKPANIMLSDDGRVKVGDFGIAKAAESSADLTQEGSYIGTAKYLAPEQVEGGPVDGRCDLYSLGVVLYEMLCGRVPFDAESSSATALARLHQDPQRPRLVRPGVPRELEAVTLRLLARRPDGRYSSATETRAALLNAGAEESTVSGEIASVVPPPPFPPGPPGPPFGGPPPPLPQGEHTQVRFTDSERRWLVPTLLVVLAMVSLGVAGLLIGGSGAGDLFDDPAEGEQPDEPTPEPLGIASATDFDPDPGDGSEHGDEVDRVYDGATGTGRDVVWDTEWYHSRDLGGLKPGVGFYVTMENQAVLDSVSIESSSEGWTVEVYVADSPGENLPSWGEPVATLEGGTAGVNPIELAEDTSGDAVLFWFTYLSPQPDDPRFRVDVAEVQVLGG